MRRTYSVRLNVNQRTIDTVVIDSHYEEKHAQSVSDEIILAIVSSLDGEEYEADRADEEGFHYFATEPHFYAGKPYRLVWLLPDDGNYLGIINCYRRPYGKRKT